MSFAGTTNRSPRILVGPLADRPAAANAHAGDGYFDPDTGTLYICYASGGVMAWSAGTSASLPTLPGVLYVDGAYTGTIQTGSIAQPYKTIMGAVAAMTAGTTILVAPGTYAENIVWRDLDKTALVAIGGKGTAFITPATGLGFAWIIGAAASVSIFRMQGFFIASQASGVQAIAIDGSALNTAFASGFLSIEDCLLSASGASQKTVDLTRLGNVTIRRCSMDHILSVSNVSDLTIEDCALDGAALRYESTNPVPIAGRKTWSIRGDTDFGAGGGSDKKLTLRGHPSIYVDRDVVVRGGVQDSGLTSTASLAPEIIFRGQVGELNNVNVPVTSLSTPQTQSGISQIVDFCGASIAGTVTMIGAIGGTGGRQRFMFRNCAIPAYQSPQFTATGDADLDLRGTALDTTTGAGTNLAVSAGGTIDRDRTWVPGVANATVDTTLTFSIPFPSYVNGNYAVVPNPTQAANVVTVSSKTAASFHWQGNVGGGTVDFLIVRQG